MLQRRRLLGGAAGAGLAGLTLGLGGARFAWAAAPKSAADSGRLVVVLLRGALDGLAAAPAIGDPQWQALRPHAAADDERFGAPLPLAASPFALHPSLRALHQW